MAECMQLFAAGHVPDFGRLIAGGAGQQAAVGAESRIAKDGAVMAAQDGDRLRIGDRAFAVDFDTDAATGIVRIRCRVKALERTGVEMEALTAVSVAALTLYDMCKAVDRAMEIGGVRLLHKSGGKSGTWQAPDAAGTDGGDA